MGSIQKQRLWILGTVVLGLGLSACVDGSNTPTSKTPNSTESATKLPKGKTTEVSAPEIFAATDRAVWDGRPTLGGIWVAHEKVSTPARVTIVNTTNGASITGALWSKSKGLPGPAFTISSDLASALKMQAGVPADLKVVALKTVEVEAPKPQEVEEIAQTTLDDAEIAEPKKEEAVVAAETKETDAVEVVTTEVAEPEEKPKKKFALFQKKTKNSVKEAPVEIEAVATPAPALETGKNYAQVGLFSDKANADALVKMLNAKSLGGHLIAGKNSKGNPFWRVLAGPATNKAAEAKLLTDVKALGFKDAYLVKG